MNSETEQELYKSSFTAAQVTDLGLKQKYAVNFFTLAVFILYTVFYSFF